MPLDLESRRRLYALVEANPGLHFRELLARSGLAHGTLQRHLRVLEEEGVLASSVDHGFTRYYAASRLREQDRPIMDALRREYSRRILAHLAAEGPLSTQALAQRLDRASSTVSWHLARLAESGLVERERSGSEVLYRLVDRERVVYLVTVFRSSLTDRIVDRLLGLWDAY